MDQSDTGGPAASPAEVRQSLDLVLSSPDFAGADRLKEFLRYVVEADLAGRAKQLRAKLIAVDVYQRRSGDADAEALVRVDAGRLRRRLELYYAGAGAQDPWRIHVDRGGYAPRYAAQDAAKGSAPSQPDPSPAAPAPRDHSKAIIMGLSAACIALALLSVGLWLRGAPRAPVSTPQAALVWDQEALVTRKVLFDENPARLQALNLVEQGQSLLLPAPDRYRIESALGLFAQAIRLDPDYAGGYAGTGLAKAIMGALMPPGPAKTEMLEQSWQAAMEATRRAPADPMSLTAQAMSAFARGEDAIALDRSAKAASLAPDDVHVRDYQALIALFLGAFDVTLEATDPSHHVGQPYQRLAWRNARATAYYLTGDAEKAVALLTEAAALGDPVSVINHAVLAASYHAVGQSDQARITINRFERAWPENNIDLMLKGLFRDPAHAAQIIDALRAAGWRAE